MAKTTVRGRPLLPDVGRVGTHPYFGRIPAVPMDVVLWHSSVFGRCFDGATRESVTVVPGCHPLQHAVPHDQRVEQNRADVMLSKNPDTPTPLA